MREGVDQRALRRLTRFWRQQRVVTPNDLVAWFAAQRGDLGALVDGIRPMGYFDGPVQEHLYRAAGVEQDLHYALLTAVRPGPGGPGGGGGRPWAAVAPPDVLDRCAICLEDLPGGGGGRVARGVRPPLPPGVPQAVGPAGPGGGALPPLWQG